MEYPVKKILPQQYPEALREIPQPPSHLFLRGTPLSVNSHNITFVGARNCTEYAKKVCQKLIQGLAPHPVTILSGLALGIDAIAHKTALEVGLPTVAVVGSGLNDDVLYPASNRPLAHQILEQHGTLLSELPPTQRATKYSFPSRNRIMAGLSEMVIAVECTERSGTRITARLGLEYNKDVCAVPHSIFSEAGAGTNALIRQGAHCVTSADDILSILGYTSSTQTIAPQQSTLTANEKKVYDLLSTPKTRTELAEELNLPLHTLQSTLTLLEIKSCIIEMMGKIQRV